MTESFNSISQHQRTRNEKVSLPFALGEGRGEGFNGSKELFSFLIEAIIKRELGFCGRVS